MADPEETSAPDMAPEAPDVAVKASRGQLIRDTIVFQFKLFVDGLRDLVFSPISIVMAILDVITGGNRFYRLLSLGRRSERYINLFGTHNRAGLDETVTRVEQLVTDEYRKGRMSASARKAVNRALDTLVKTDKPDT